MYIGYGDILNKINKICFQRVYIILQENRKQRRKCRCNRDRVVLVGKFGGIEIEMIFFIRFSVGEFY